MGPTGGFLSTIFVLSARKTRMRLGCWSVKTVAGGGGWTRQLLRLEPKQPDRVPARRMSAMGPLIDSALPW